MTLDTSSYFYPSNMHSVDDPFSSIDTFSEFVDDIPFVSKNEQERETLLFQLCTMRSELVDLATQVRIKGNVDHLRTEKLLKDVYSKLDQDTLSEVKYFMSAVVAFPVSEAIVESWGSVIDNVISNKIAFKEADSPDITDMTEKVVFIKLVGPLPGAASNQKII